MFYYLLNASLLQCVQLSQKKKANQSQPLIFFIHIYLNLNASCGISKPRSPRTRLPLSCSRHAAPRLVQDLSVSLHLKNLEYQVGVAAFLTCGFESRPRRCQATTLGKLFTHMCLCYQAVRVGTGVKAGKVTADYGRDVICCP